MKLAEGRGGGGGVLTRYETKSRTSKLLEYYYSKASNFAIVYLTLKVSGKKNCGDMHLKCISLGRS